MSNAILNEKNRNKEELEAMEVAEEARETEWENPSFAAELFMGKFNTSAIFPYPEQSDEDKRIGDEYLAKLERFLKENLDPDKVDEEGVIPEKAMKGLAEIGAFGMKIPKEYGGLGLSQVNYNRALAMIAGYCSSTTALLSAHQSIGVPQPLKLFGTEAQKKKYLPRLAKGAVSAFALTEPEVGSDPARMSTTAVPSEDGSHYIINGTKLWCTNGAIAEILVVMALTPSIMKNGREKKQITAFIVEKDTPGFEVLHRCRFMGLNGIQNALLKFTNVKVPKENIIWGLGKGLRLALVTLNAGRLSLPSGCIGGMRQGIRMAKDWATSRSQWGALIGKHDAVANKIAVITSDLFAIEAITWLTGAWVDSKHQDIRLEAAICKVFASEHAHKAVEELVQIRGGRGYERATSLRARGEKPYPVERMLRDSRINMIVEGTSEILRLFIAREALDQHLKIAGDVLNSKLSIGKRLAAAVKAAGFYVYWYPYQWLAPTFSYFFYWPMSVGNLKLMCQLRYVSRMSHKLARTTFHQMLLNGPKLEKKHMQLSRIVDIAMDLFAIAASTARAAKKSAQGHKNAPELSNVFYRGARKRILSNFASLCCNHDKKAYQLAQNINENKYNWLEQDMVK